MDYGEMMGLAAAIADRHGEVDGWTFRLTPEGVFTYERNGLIVAFTPGRDGEGVVAADLMDEAGDREERLGVTSIRGGAPTAEDIVGFVRPLLRAAAVIAWLDWERGGAPSGTEDASCDR